MRVGIHEAKTHLSRLIPAVQDGEEVVITKSGVPVAKLVPIATVTEDRPLGRFRDKVTIKGDLLAPLPEEVLATFRPKEKQG